MLKDLSVDQKKKMKKLSKKNKRLAKAVKFLAMLEKKGINWRAMALHDGWSAEQIAECDEALGIIQGGDPGVC